MNILIGFNIIMGVVWFLAALFHSGKKDDFTYFYSNWGLLCALTWFFSIGVYYLSI